MKKVSFNLTSGGVVSLSPAPVPAEYRLPVAGLDVVLKKKAMVAAGGVVATSVDNNREDVHSPVDGIVTDVRPEYVVISPLPPETDTPQDPEAEAVARPEPIRPVNLDALLGDELVLAAHKLGVSLHDLGKHAELLVINCLNPEPGICFAAALLEEHADTLKAGLALLRRTGLYEQISVVLPDAATIRFDDDIRLCYVKPVYPNSRPALAALAATGREMRPNVSVLSLHTLWRLGRLAESGLPVTETVISLAGKNYLVRAGTTIHALLAHAHVPVEEGDCVILGGIMRGEAVADVEQPIPLYAYALSRIPYQEFWPVGEHPCINCGACVYHCPSRLMPNFLGRHAEFANFEATRDLHIERCMDCGLCSYHCIARRPMLQYMRISKAHLANPKQGLTGR